MNPDELRRQRLMEAMIDGLFNPIDPEVIEYYQDKYIREQQEFDTLLEERFDDGSTDA